MITVRVEGLTELRKALLELPKELQRGPLRSAVSAGAKVIQQQAIANAPEDTGVLKRAIYRTRSRSGSSPVQEMHVVGWRSGWKYQARRTKKGKLTTNRDAWYGRFIEFGTSKMAARPFLRPAFDTTKERAVVAIVEKLRAAIARAAAKLSWK